MSLAAGTKLGPYEILAPIGAGGMGEVYRARDRRLGREVAIKVLPEAVALDPDRLRRFEQEARSASALNHPSIVTIYDVGQTDGVSWIAMELVEGASLRQLLAGGALTAKRTLAIGAQIASGLAKAHTAAIVHRDLKPENVMVTPEGLAKILDFGLAKAAPQTAEDSQVATAAPQTDAGVVLGTVGYMSPEQAMGRTVDYRTDQFALGAILYEMASGRRAFQRATPIETLSAILKEEPVPLSSSGSEAPEALAWVIDRCLAKEPEERYQSTRDLAQDLAAARDRASSGSPATSQPPRAVASPNPSRNRIRARLLLAGLAVAAVVTFMVVRGRASSAPPGAVHSLAVLPLKPLGGDAADEALGLGIADSIIRGLSGAGAIPVRPLSAVRRYAKSDADAVTAAKELKTDAVLEGSVQRAGGKLRVTVNLLRVDDGRSLWAESFDVPASEVFEVQDAVSEAVVSRLSLHLGPGQRDRMKKRFTQSPEAYLEFMLGRSVEGKAGPGWGGEHLGAAIRHYERAVALDPGYALAHARLALAYLWRDLFFEPGAGYLEKGKASVAQAERLDPQLAETHQFGYQLAWSHYQGFDIPAALRELRAAHKLDPLVAHEELAILYAHIGLDGPFRREAMRGLEIDPSSDVTKRFSVEGLVLLGHAEEAVAMAKERGLPASESRLPMSLISLGRFDEARAATDALLRKTPDHHQAVAMRELVAVVSKERPPDEAALARALESGKLKRDYHHTTYAVACIRAAQGDNPGAVEMLRRTVATGMPDRTLFLADPLLARLRPSREFAAFDAEFEPNWRRLEKEATGD
jgi:serine/threonine protein kinase/tetratricopeptide (TPR) repeat protein